MAQLSRRNAIKISLAVPVLGASPGCDGGLIIAIITLIVNAIAVGASVAAQASGEPIKLIDVTDGYVKLKNNSASDQILEILVELIDIDGTPQNSEVLETHARELPTIKSGSKVKLALPNLESSHAGEHYVRVSVAGAETYSEVFSMQEYE